MNTDDTAAGALRARLRSDGLVVAWFTMASPPLVEIGARAGFDAAVIDLQHGLWDRMSTHLAISALGPIPALARTASDAPAAIGEALDSGAVGVIVPLVESGAQAAAAVAAASFPPRGRRSGGGVRPVAEGFADYWRRNAEPLVGVMIETAAGLSNAAEIARTPGVDFVFIGPGDLALSLGCFPEIDARHGEACAAILQACQAVDLPCGIFSNTAEAARVRLAEGYKLVVPANDIEVVAAGFAHAARTVRG